MPTMTMVANTGLRIDTCVIHIGAGLESSARIWVLAWRQRAQHRRTAFLEIVEARREHLRLFRQRALELDPRR